MDSFEPLAILFVFSEASHQLKVVPQRQIDVNTKRLFFPFLNITLVKGIMKGFIRRKAGNNTQRRKIAIQNM